MSYRERLSHLGGLIALLTIGLLLVVPPLGLFLLGLIGVLVSPILVALLLWSVARAMVLDMWAALLRRL